MSKFIYDTAYFTHAGKVRTHNEDSYYIQHKETEKGHILLVAVADGMGGLSDGKEASSKLILSLDKWWNNELPSILQAGENTLNLAESSLNQYIAQANQEIFNLDKKMGTTLSLVLVIDEQYLIKHAGDSRIYFFRTIGLEQITSDHTWYEQELERGTLQLYENVSVAKMQSVLTNAIGVKNDFWLQRARGDMNNIEYILLCSDGIYKYVSSEDLNNIFYADTNLAEKQNALEKILQASEAADNYTAIIIQKKKKSSWKFAGLWNKH